MFRLRSFACVAGVVVAVVVGGSSRPAFAIKQFFDEFKALYVQPDSGDANVQSLAAEVETSKCNVCHVGKNKKERNAYGHALAELLDKKEDAKNIAKIKESLEKVASLPSDPKKADSPTFGDRIKEGKLPAVAAE